MPAGRRLLQRASRMTADESLRCRLPAARGSITAAHQSRTIPVADNRSRRACHTQELFSLRGKVALVTGSSKGIGRVIVETFAGAGARVVVSSRRRESCQPVADDICAAGGEAVAIPCHMSHLDQVRVLVDEAMAQWGRVDVLVCNAAVNPHFGPMATVTEAAYDKIMATNVKHNLWLCNLVLPQMAGRKDGSIIIVSSIGGLKGHDTLGIYAMSKAADCQLARNLAVEWGRSNIRANCIAPGLVRTDFAPRAVGRPRPSTGGDGRLSAGTNRRTGGHGRGGAAAGVAGRTVHHRTGAGRRRRGDDLFRPNTSNETPQRRRPE